MTGSRAYAVSAQAWADGPERVLYDRLAEVLVHACPPAIQRARVLDLGAGTGTASRAALAAGARVVAADAAVEMLRHDASVRPPAVAADACHLPFGDGSFGGVLAAFVLNHLPDPTLALTEVARILRPGGFLVATTFHAGWDHPVKHVVDEAAAEFGFRPPGWYIELKRGCAPRAGDPAAMVGCAEAAGLVRALAVVRTVDIGACSRAALVRWRLGMAHLAPFVASLPPDERRRLAERAAAGIASDETTLRPQVLLLRADRCGPSARPCQPPVDILLG